MKKKLNNKLITDTFIPPGDPIEPYEIDPDLEIPQEMKHKSRTKKTTIKVKKIRSDKEIK